MQASAIVLAHGPEPELVACVQALLATDATEVLVVDNEAAPGPIADVEALSGVTVLYPGRNLGYAGGCNYAAAKASGDVLVFVNSDALVAADTVQVLADRVADPAVGLACASIRLADDPDLLNSGGNPVHYLMFSWAGSLGEPASAHAATADVASISGATFAVRREVWEHLGGFDEAYFAYCEDVYLSLRAWQAGYRVVYEPAAVAVHHYDFGRHDTKHYLLERNRLLNLFLLPEKRTRWLLAPPAAVVELGVLLVALRDGWAADKVAGWRWLADNRRQLIGRRRVAQATRRVPDRELAALLRGPLDPPPGLGPSVPAPVSRVLDSYWTLVRRWL